MRNPYEDAFYYSPVMRAPRTYHHRHYTREHYNAARDMNDTARVVVGGAVVIGTLGLLGAMMR
jgi:hypothetical protein